MLKFITFIILVSIAYIIFDVIGSIAIICFYIGYFIFSKKKNNYFEKAAPYVRTADNIHTAHDVVDGLTDTPDPSDIINNFS